MSGKTHQQQIDESVCETLHQVAEEWRDGDTLTYAIYDAISESGANSDYGERVESECLFLMRFAQLRHHTTKKLGDILDLIKDEMTASPLADMVDHASVLPDANDLAYLQIAGQTWVLCPQMRHYRWDMAHRGHSDAIDMRDAHPGQQDMFGDAA